LTGVVFELGGSLLTSVVWSEHDPGCFLSRQSASEATFTAHDLQFLQVFASQAATAVSNSGGLSQEAQPQGEPKEFKDVEKQDADASDLKKNKTKVASDADCLERKQPGSCSDQTTLVNSEPPSSNTTPVKHKDSLF
jgi:hypothetical protein